MAICNWPAEERPREKLIGRGPGALSDAELLAIFLRTGTKGRSAVDLARGLLAEYGSLGRLLTADEKQFCASHGLGQAKYALLQAALEMARRHFGEALARGDAITNPSQSRDYLHSCLAGYPHEVFACLFLDNRHRMIAFEELFRGTIDGASVHPREILRRTLFHNAAAVILAHNHPSGVAEPSQSDRRITRRLKEALGLIDVRVLDHIVVGSAETTSMAELGLI